MLAALSSSLVQSSTRLPTWNTVPTQPASSFAFRSAWAAASSSRTVGSMARIHCVYSVSDSLVALPSCRGDRNPCRGDRQCQAPHPLQHEFLRAVAACTLDPDLERCVVLTHPLQVVHTGTGTTSSSFIICCIKRGSSSMSLHHHLSIVSKRPLFHDCLRISIFSLQKFGFAAFYSTFVQL